jgi:hypothetical protein
MASEREEEVERLRRERPEDFEAVHCAGFAAGLKFVEAAAAEAREKTIAYIVDVKGRILAEERTRCAALVRIGAHHSASPDAVAGAIADGIGASEFVARLGVAGPKPPSGEMN